MDTNSLTRFKKGSILELFSVALPIIVSAASGYLMVAIDRIILSRYSQEAFNACFCSAQWYYVAYITLVELVMMVEVFVGQYNGSREYQKAGECVWQMIWFCLFTFIFFIPFAHWGSSWLVQEEMAKIGVPYLKILLAFIPLDVLGFGVLTGFFVGIGQTSLIPLCSIFSNLLNLVLDVVLVFGCGPIPEMGALGAATATVVSQVVFALTLFCIFLKKSNRKRYGTLRFKPNPTMLWRCIVLGVPNSLNRFINSLFWTLAIGLIARKVSADEFSGFSISHSIYFVFYFIIEGVTSGTRTVCANAIGSNEYGVIYKNLRSWLILSGIFVFIIAFGMVIYPDALIQMFLKDAGSGDVYFIAKHMMIWAWLMFVIDSISSNFMSMLLASGDTRFTMVVNTTCFIGISVLPMIICICFYGASSLVSWQFMILDSVVRSLIYCYRLKSGRWLKRAKLNL